MIEAIQAATQDAIQETNMGTSEEDIQEMTEEACTEGVI